MTLPFLADTYQILTIFTVVVLVINFKLFKLKLAIFIQLGRHIILMVLIIFIPTTGLFRKLKGQIMQVAALLHALFGIEHDYTHTSMVSDAAILFIWIYKYTMYVCDALTVLSV